MSFEVMMEQLNPSQKEAVSVSNHHALVIAGAGCGKTKTIIARASYLISQGIPPERIQILTFTRRSANEIVERVRLALGERSISLKASTFHTWCTSIVRRSPKIFGFKNFTVIDRDDQLQMFKSIRGRLASSIPLTAAKLCDLYSYARNSRQRLDDVLRKEGDVVYAEKVAIFNVMKDYESRKRERNYFDYDDILDVVAKGISQYPELCEWLGSQYDHILVDEMQDTNPLQWDILQPLSSYSKLFCVGDNAQCIYGFRGADFRIIQEFQQRISNSKILKLQDNYRSTQEILDLSNWLLSKSSIDYGKNLRAIRGHGKKPLLETFMNAWEEGRWIAEDLLRRKNEGASWRDHMVLVRSSFSARTVEQALLAKDIPYVFIGGTKLLESAHVKDVLSALRVIGNYTDEIAWMRFLTLWPGVGEVTASKLIEKLLNLESFSDCVDFLKSNSKINESLVSVLSCGLIGDEKITDLLTFIVKTMSGILSERYKNQHWDKRVRDFKYVIDLSEKHSSILEFLEEYVLDPVYVTVLDHDKNSDVVQVITIHSAKGTEKDVCYVHNVSIGSYPSSYALKSKDEIEEERRVLYVALTRAKNELILTRTEFSFLALSTELKDSNATSKINDNEKEGISLSDLYYLNEINDDMILETIHRRDVSINLTSPTFGAVNIKFGVDLS